MAKDQPERRLAKALGELLLAVAGAGLLIALPLGAIDLPSVPLPDLPDVPGWVASALDGGKFVALIGIALVALYQLNGRR